MGQKTTQSDMERSKRMAVDLGNVYAAGSALVGAQWLKKRADRVRGCSDVWAGYVCSHCGAVTHMHAYGCGDRLCPICTVRKSRATAAQALAVVDKLVGRPVLLTLTQRNVEGQVLAGCLRDMSTAWSKMRRLRYIDRNITAWAKTTEITYNRYRKDYHPHIHIIAYVRADDTTMLRADYWANTWQQCMDLDYTPIVDVREVTDDHSAVYEVSKYLSKTHSLLSLPYDDKVAAITTIAVATKGMRMRSYGGDWRKYRSRLGQRDPDDMSVAELDAASTSLDEMTCCDVPMTQMVMAWSGYEYKFARYGGLYNDETHERRDAHGDDGRCAANSIGS